MKVAIISPNLLAINVALRKERDFYFSKLRDIEVICHESEETERMPIIQRILGILYKTDDGFASPDDTPEQDEH